MKHDQSTISRVPSIIPVPSVCSLSEKKILIFVELHVIEILIQTHVS